MCRTVLIAKRIRTRLGSFTALVHANTPDHAAKGQNDRPGRSENPIRRVPRWLPQITIPGAYRRGPAANGEDENDNDARYDDGDGQ
jgi:hypothetical protein